jgi:hypothetical protein
MGCPGRIFGKKKNFEKRIRIVDFGSLLDVNDNTRL